MGENSNSTFVDLCVEITMAIKNSGLSNFTFILKSENLNYTLNTGNTNGENVETKIKRRKNKSPSSRRRNLKRLRNWMSMKNDQFLDTTTTTQSYTGRAQDPITCATCDRDFPTDRSLSSHISLKHKNMINQLDGIALSEDEDPELLVQTLSEDEQDDYYLFD